MDIKYRQERWLAIKNRFEGLKNYWEKVKKSE